MLITALATATAADCQQAILELGAELRFTPPEGDEVDAARIVAAKLMDHEVVEAESVLSILAIQPASTLVYREQGEVTGVVATLLLRPAAEPAIVAGRFDGIAPFEPYLARGRDHPSACYYWGIAGATKDASAAAMEFFRRIRFDVLADLTAYVLAATPIGRHVAIKRLGLSPIRHPDDNLLSSGPIAARRAA
jgi:hypothetical protein